MLQSGVCLLPDVAGHVSAARPPGARARKVPPDASVCVQGWQARGLAVAAA